MFHKKEISIQPFRLAPQRPLDLTSPSLRVDYMKRQRKVICIEKRSSEEEIMFHKKEISVQPFRLAPQRPLDLTSPSLRVDYMKRERKVICIEKRSSEEEIMFHKKGLDTTFSACASKATRSDIAVTSSELHGVAAEGDLYREAFIRRGDYVS